LPLEYLTLKNRRLFRVKEQLCEQAGLPMASSDPGLSLVEIVGCYGLLAGSIEAYAGAAGSRRRRRRAEKQMFTAMDPAAACRASILLTFSLAELLARLGEDVQQQYHAIDGTFELPEEDGRWIDGLLTAAWEQPLDAEVELSLQMVEYTTGVKTSAREGVEDGIQWFGLTSVALPSVWQYPIQVFHPPLASRAPQASDSHRSHRATGMPKIAAPR
jgi:hypothetical protein